MTTMLTLAWLTGFAAWLADIDHGDYPMLLGQSVVAGLSGGIVIGMWT